MPQKYIGLDNTTGLKGLYTPAEHTQNTDTGTTAADFAISGANAIKEGDSRLTDARTPVSHNNTYHSATYIIVGDIFSGLAKISVGTSTPGSPSIGDLWVDTN